MRRGRWHPCRCPAAPGAVIAAQLQHAGRPRGRAAWSSRTMRNLERGSGAVSHGAVSPRAHERARTVARSRSRVRERTCARARALASARARCSGGRRGALPRSVGPQAPASCTVADRGTRPGRLGAGGGRLRSARPFKTAVRSRAPDATRTRRDPEHWPARRSHLCSMRTRARVERGVQRSRTRAPCEACTTALAHATLHRRRLQDAAHKHPSHHMPSEDVLHTRAKTKQRASPRRGKYNADGYLSCAKMQGARVTCKEAIARARARAHMPGGSRVAPGGHPAKGKGRLTRPSAPAATPSCPLRPDSDLGPLGSAARPN